MRLDQLPQHPAQHIRPGVIRRHPQPDPLKLAAQHLRRNRAVVANARQQIHPGIARKRRGHRNPLRLQPSLAGPPAKAQNRPRHPAHRHHVLHQDLVTLADPIPLQHGELRRVQSPPLAVAPDMGKSRNPHLPRRQQLLHRKLRAGVQIHLPPHPIIANRLSAKAMQMRLIARRHRQGRRLHLHKPLLRQPAPDPRLNPPALDQQSAPVRMPLRPPPRRIAIFARHLEISRHIG